MLTQKELFIKHLKLLSAGLISTNAKSFHQMTLQEVLDHPYEGLSILNLENKAAVATEIDLTTEETLEKYELSLNIASSLTEFSLGEKLFNALKLLNKLKNLNEMNFEKNDYALGLIITGIQLIKDSCIVDSSSIHLKYLITDPTDPTENTLEKTPEELEAHLRSLSTTIKDQIVSKINSTFINEINQESFTYFKILKTLKNDLLNLNLDSRVGEPGEPGNPLMTIGESPLETTSLWFDSLFEDLIVVVNFEFMLRDNKNSMNLNGWEVIPTLP